MREAEDKVRAFYNVCPHRGNQIRNPGMGHAESFQCAYHFFEFNLDGSKKFVPDEDTFTQGVPQETALVEVPCDTWGGFIFFNMNPDAEPLLEFLDPVAQHLDAYHMEEFSIVSDKTSSGTRTGRPPSTRSTRSTMCRASTRSCWRGWTTSTSRSTSTSATTATWCRWAL